MRLAGIPYAFRAGVRYLRNAPEGKLPCIDDDGEWEIGLHGGQAAG